MPGEKSTPEVIGEFDIHITVTAPAVDQRAEDFANRNGLKYTHIALDSGRTVSQPMFSLTGSGHLDEMHELAERWGTQLRDEGFRVWRTKIEAAPWCRGVPATDEEAAAQPADRYFEHHVKLLLPAGAIAVVQATDLAERHGARVSRNARRIREDGRQERFVTQRCRGMGRAAASARLKSLVAAFTEAGHDIVAVEEEYVVFDDRVDLDAGWLESSAPKEDWRVTFRRQKAGTPAEARGFPPSYRPLPPQPGVQQGIVFDPALLQYENAYRAGEPVFDDPAAELRWRTARRTAMRHLLAVLTDTTWAQHLVLRGSFTMSAWFADAAREPGDLDFVVTPQALDVRSADAEAMLTGILQALRDRPGGGLDPDRAQTTDIWTYERADGRRLIIPFRTADGQSGSVQADFVFGEHLPLAPVTILLEGVARPLLAAGPEMSLAWKLMWLGTDMHPQGKDLYDAVLLAEHTTVERGLVRELLRPELGAEADDFSAESVLDWDVDWTNFTDEYPTVTGTADSWRRRLVFALDRMPGWR